MKKIVFFAVITMASAGFCAETDSTIIKLDQKITALKQQQEQLREQFKAQYNQMEGAIMALEAVKKEFENKKINK